MPIVDHAIIACDSVVAAEAVRDRLAALPSGAVAVGFGVNSAEGLAVRCGPSFAFLFGMDRPLRRQGGREQIELVFFNPLA